MSAAFSIPEALVRCRTEQFGEAGAAWLARLPGIVAGCAARWSLAVADPYPNLSYNYVAPATRADGSAAVLKVCYPEREFYTEAEALRLYDGRGCARLLAADLDQGALLIERVLPGRPLAEVTNVAEMSHAAADVMRLLWRPAPATHSFPTADDWVLAMDKRGRALRSVAPTFAWDMVDRALALYGELAPGAGRPMLLHGDLHQTNILAAQREPWLAIDPKGIVGPPIFELGPLFFNAVADDATEPEARRILDTMVDCLAEALTLDRQEVRAWGYVRSVLAAYWTVEDHGDGWDGALWVANLLAGRHPAGSAICSL